MNFANIAEKIIVAGFILSLVVVTIFSAILLSEGNLFGIVPLAAVVAFTTAGKITLKESRARN
jgi:hypothetical protein